VNIAANVVSPANDFANAFRIDRLPTGGLITGIVGIVIQPWLLADPGPLYVWGCYSGGPVDRRVLIALGRAEDVAGTKIST
jgi:NCS1 family nucleobase:cation symporter-1